MLSNQTDLGGEVCSISFIFLNEWDQCPNNGPTLNVGQSVTPAIQPDSVKHHHCTLSLGPTHTLLGSLMDGFPCRSAEIKFVL